MVKFKFLQSDEVRMLSASEAVAFLAGLVHNHSVLITGVSYPEDNFDSICFNCQIRS